MPYAELQRNGAEQHVQERRPPGVYRPVTTDHATGSLSPPTASAGTSSEHETANSSYDVDPAATDARRRFYQLRSMRRELSGRPAVLDGVSNNDEEFLSAQSAPSASPPIIHVHPTSIPVPTSYGLSLDRLPVEDAATRYILRTAAAERVLRHQQMENEDLKRLLITQRQESDNLRQQLERLSQELDASSQTVLRQTATMRSLSSEMERLNAYRLIKARRASSTDVAPPPSTGEEGVAAHPSAPRAEALAAEVAQLKSEKGLLGLQLKRLRQEQMRTPHNGDANTVAVEVIERDYGELTADGCEGDRVAHHGVPNAWIPFAAEELQRLVQVFGGVLTGASPRRLIHPPSPTFLSPALKGASDLVLEVTLSNLSFTLASPSAGRQRGGHKGDTLSSSHENHGVLWVCGPYNKEHLLLRVHAASPQVLSVPPAHRRPLSRDQPYRRCCFYTLLDTQGVLTFCFFGKANNETTTPAAVVAGDTPTPTATATVPMRSLTAAAATPYFSDGDVGSSTSGVSTVHTIHLHKDGCAASCGAATFVVCVNAVRPLTTCDVTYRCRATERRAEQAVDSAGVGLLHPAIEHTRPRAPLLSPSREDEASDVARRSVSAFSFPLSSGKATPLQCRTPPLVDGGVPPRSPCPHALAAAVAALEDVEGGETAPATATEGESAKGGSGDAATSLLHGENNAKSSPTHVLPAETSPSPTRNSRSGPLCVPAPPAAVVPLPLCVSVPTAPAVTHSPTPPAAVDPPHLSASSPSASRSASRVSSSSVPTEAPTNLRIYVKSLRDFHHSSLEDVGDLLEHCALQVSVSVGEKEVLAVTSGHIPSHAVWSAEEGTCSAAISASQDVRFEVRDASKGGMGEALAQAIVRAEDVGETWGERELALTAVTDNALFGGTLTVCFSPGT